MEILTTDRLRLRTAQAEDAPFYLTLVNDPAFVAFIGQRNLHTLDAARQALLDGPIAMQATHGHSMYLVELRSDGTPIGMCGLIKREALPEVDIGYAYLPAWRGQGYAHEAGAAVLAHARALGMERIMAITSLDNIASMRLLEKFGLRWQHVARVKPYEADSNVYLGDLNAICGG